jgi:hypothetical protein
VNESAARVLQEYHFKWKREETQSNPVIITGWDKSRKCHTFDQDAPNRFMNGIITAIMRDYTLSQSAINALWAVTPQMGENVVSVTVPHCVEQRVLDLTKPSLGLPIAPTLFYSQISNFKAFDLVLCYSTIATPAPNTNTNTAVRRYIIEFIQCSLKELYYHEKDSEQIKKAFGLRMCFSFSLYLWISFE